MDLAEVEKLQMAILLVSSASTKALVGIAE
jgi:hypothetical protein